MTQELKFNIVLKSKPVTLIDEDKKEKKFRLKELTGDQRAVYQECFDVKIEMDGDKVKATAGEQFRMMPAKEFLSLCLYDENDVLIKEDVIGKYPSRVLEDLYEAALKLSGMDKDTVEAKKAKAKNE